MSTTEFVAAASRLTLSALLALTVCASCSRSALADDKRVRMLFQVDYAEALSEKRIAKGDSNEFDKVAARIVVVLKKRLDPSGKLGVDVFARDVETIVVEAPASMEAPENPVELLSTQEVATDSLTIPLEVGKKGETTMYDFPDTGGEVEIDGEHIRYANRQSNALCELTRGLDATLVAKHEAGAIVRLRHGDTLRRRVECMGEFRLMPVYEAGEPSSAGVDFHAERERFKAWVGRDSGAPLSTFNRASTEEGGPTALQWIPVRSAPGEKPTTPESRTLPLVVPPANWRFTEADIAHASIGTTLAGRLAVSIEFDPKRASAFSEYTESLIGSKLAFVLDDEVLVAPVIRTKLPAAMVLDGGASSAFTSARAAAIAAELEAGSLPAPLRFRLRESIEPKH